MLTPEKMKEIRKKALAAVADMPDGELKTKAFEIFLQRLLDLETSSVVDRSKISARQIGKVEKRKRQPGTVKSRILLLKDEGFFDMPKSISEVRDELRAHGWIHPTTALSGPLQGLVRERLLRRIKDRIWKYVNP